MENDLKPILEIKGSIEFENPLYINFYGIDSVYVTKIIIGDEDSVLICDNNDVAQYITDIRDIEDFQTLCTELGM